FARATSRSIPAQLPTVALHGPRTVSENVRHVTGTVNEQPVDPIGWQAVTMMWALKVIRSTTAAARRGRRRWPWPVEQVAQRSVARSSWDRHSLTQHSHLERRKTDEARSLTRGLAEPAKRPRVASAGPPLVERPDDVLR